jgi:general secretion pathway protein C
MTSRLLTFAVWALVAASALAWGLKLFVKTPALPSAVQFAGRDAGLAGDLEKLLGASTEVDVEASAEPSDGGGAYRLLGVVAPVGAAASSQGVALIAIGDQPAKAWRTGAVIDGDTVLLSVGKRSAQLGPVGGPPTTELSLPEPAPAAVGAVPGVPSPIRPNFPGIRPQPRPAQPGMAPGQAGEPAAAQGEEEED